MDRAFAVNVEVFLAEGSQRSLDPRPERLEDAFGQDEHSEKREKHVNQVFQRSPSSGESH